LADAEAAAKAQPQYAKAHSRRGLALWHMNRYHEAAEAYQRAMQLDDSSADAKEARALINSVAFCGISPQILRFRRAMSAP
jgi:tetratricopeptide (TPR) repeat protein